MPFAVILFTKISLSLK